MNVKMSFDPTPLQKALDNLSKKQEENVAEQVTRSAYAIEKDAKEAVPVFLGALRASLNVKRTNKNMTAFVGSGVLSGDALSYAEAIEFGRKPGSFPAYQEGSGLYQWVKLKLGIVGKMTKSVAFLIARKIEQNGTKGQPYLMPAFKKEVRIFEARLREILKGVK